MNAKGPTISLVVPGSVTSYDQSIVNEPEPVSSFLVKAVKAKEWPQLFNWLNLPEQIFANFETA